MGRKNKRGQVLTWQTDGNGKRSGRWKGTIGGRLRYFGPGRCRSNKEDYLAALADYRQKLAKWELEQELNDGLKEAMALNEAFKTKLWAALDIDNRNDDEDGEWVDQGDGVSQVLKPSDKPKYPKEPPMMKLLLALQRIYQYNPNLLDVIRYFASPDFVAPTAKEESKPTQTVADVLKEFDKNQKERKISPKRKQSIQNYSNKFRNMAGDREWLGTSQQMKDLLNDWQKLAQEWFDKTGSNATYDNYMSFGSFFTNWVYDEEILTDKPRKIKELTERKGGETKAESIQDVTIIRKLFSLADDELKTYIAIALNCGFKAGEVSELVSDDVKGDYLVRIRGKTEMPSAHKMWDVTKKLIERTRNGKKLYMNEKLALFETENGKQIKNRLWRSWRELCNRTGFDYDFTHLQDTVSTEVWTKFPHLQSLFITHGTNKDDKNAKLYIDVNNPSTYTIFDKVIAHTEQYFGLTLDEKDE